MSNRKSVFRVFSVLVVLSMLVGLSGQAFAAPPTPPAANPGTGRAPIPEGGKPTVNPRLSYPGMGGMGGNAPASSDVDTSGLPFLKKGPITQADREAAAANRAAARKAAGPSVAAAFPVVAPNGYYVPDYFGTAPNWAYSPLPSGPISNIVVTNGGTDYTGAITVTITDAYGFGSGATAATAVLSGTSIISITGGTGGTGYMAPVVNIDNATGSGAAATAVIAPAVGTGIRKFVNGLPSLTIGTKDTVSYSGSDYYVIAVVEYTQTFHADLPPTTLRGYVQLASPGAPGSIPLFRADGVTPIYMPDGITQAMGVTKPSYLGPTIVATRDVPVRVLFYDLLPTGAGGDLFIPTDTTYMGAGMGPMGSVTDIKITNGGAGYLTAPAVTLSDPGGGGIQATAVARILAGKINNIQVTNVGSGYMVTPTVTIAPPPAGGTQAVGTAVLGDGSNYTENRATVHLHGGTTPWISDGTPHQWTTPAGENTAYPEGVSVYNVPDMPDPGPGALTFFYSNQQSARLMFYHDHAYGLTRLNVYAGEAAGYLLTDSTEQTLINGGTLTTTAGTTITVAPGTLPGLGTPLIIQDKTFVDAKTIGLTDPTWAWGTKPGKPVATANTGDLWFPHVYMPNQNPYDVSGANAMGRWDYGPWFWPPYTGLIYDPIANPYADQPGEPPVIPAIPNPSGVPESFMDTPTVNGMAYPTMTVPAGLTRFRILNASNDRFLNLSLWVADPAITTTDGRLNTEVKMVGFNSCENATNPFPSWWYTAGLPFTFDDRVGGVPDPATRGPAMIQIGTEGGFLPNPAVIRNQPINYTYNRKNIVVLSVQEHALLLGPAERADILVDFTNFAGKTLILYSDSPAPIPAGDSRVDYYTGDPGQTDTGGAPSTVAGYGPNTRTIMQIVVQGSGGLAPTDDYSTTVLANLQNVLPAAFNASQETPIVPQAPYNAAYNGTFPGDIKAYVPIQASTYSFTPIGSSTVVTANLQPKAIQELFTVDYGRMNATLGVEIPNSNATNQTTIPYGYIDPVTEIIQVSDSKLVSVTNVNTFGDGTQIWKITHNGVDTHVIHVHMFTMQLINRVGWDGAIRPPDANELGWKDTYRMNPLEDVIVAVRPIMLENLPFELPNSYRPMDVTQPLGGTAGFFNVDTAGLPVTVVNDMVNFGWEYVWHCHILGHEENDMMRPMAIGIPPTVPISVTVGPAFGVKGVTLNWVGPLVATEYTVQRATDAGFTLNVRTFTTDGPATTYTDTTVATGQTYFYRVMATNVVGSLVAGYPTMTLNSAYSTGVSFTTSIPAAPTLLGAVALSATQVRLNWTSNSANADHFTIQRATNAGFTQNLVAFTVAGTITTYLNSPVTAGTTFYYRVYAVNVFGTSAPSNTATVTTPQTIPLAPTGLTTTLQSTSPLQIRLNWTDNSNNETGFVIERALGIGAGITFAPIFTTTANVVAYVDTTVNYNTTYSWRVRAYNSAGYSAYTNIASRTTPVNPLPAPTNLIVAANIGLPNRTISLQWTNGAPLPQGYYVERSTRVGGVFQPFVQIATINFVTTTFNDRTVSGSTTYQYRIRGFNANGPSAYSNTVTVTTVP